ALQLKEGLQIIGDSAFGGCKSLRSVTLPSTVTELSRLAFSDCGNLVELQLKEGLQVIKSESFRNCTALQNVTLPSSVIELRGRAFDNCSSLVDLQLKEGLQVIGEYAFGACLALRSREDRGLLNQEAIDEMLFDVEGSGTFFGCPFTMVKISISWALSERMARLPKECMLFVVERVHNLRHLELLQDGDVLACFPVIRTEPHNGTYEVRDTNLETARSLYQVLQLIAFHELKESSILIELAFWKSIIDKGGDRACRVAISGPAKSLLMEYCGFAGFLRPEF
ncbi:hypothetical protein THAOC_25188, partial [Thalassiosira oceanica]